MYSLSLSVATPSIVVNLSFIGLHVQFSHFHTFFFFFFFSFKVFYDSGFTRTLCGGAWESLTGSDSVFNNLGSSTARLGCCSPGTFMENPTLTPFSKATACKTCAVGQYGSDVDNDDTSCTACVNQVNCAASTPNTCSTTNGATTKTPCTSVTAPEYYLDGDKVATCATSGNGTNAATITCTTGTNQVATTCNAGYGLVKSACVACDAYTFAIQGNSAVCQTCASGSYTDTGTGTTGTTCNTCATSGLDANVATVTCTSSTNQVTTACNAGYGLVGSACVAKCSLADQLVYCSPTQLAEIARHYQSRGQC